MKKLLCIAIFFSIYFGYAQINVSSLKNKFNSGGALSLDKHDNLFTGDLGDFLSADDTDELSNNIWKLDKNSNLLVSASGFIGVSGNDFDSKGVLYQSDINN